MLTRGNHKLGPAAIWAFSLPAGTAACPGATPTCRRHCYAARLEGFRPAAAAKYRRNLALSRRPDFARRVRAFLVAHAVRVVRVHVGGDFYSARYARAWLAVMRRSPGVRFYFYTRSWRVPGVRAEVDRMAALPNCRAWYSADRDTGVPAGVPPGARVAWLRAGPGDAPPPGTDLVFRVRAVRRTPEPAGGAPACPAEAGAGPGRPVTCDRCRACWAPPRPARVPLPVLAPDEGGRPCGST